MLEQYVDQPHARRKTSAGAWIATLTATLALAGCLGNSNSDNPTTAQSGVQTGASQIGSAGSLPAMTPAQADAPAVTQASQFNVTIPAFDGTPIVATVYVPKLAAGEATPLLLHSHGFGGNRVATLDFDTQSSEIGQYVMQMAYNQRNPVQGRTGWYVISYDQRGHGDSGGQVRILDPNTEGRDFKTVLDWAEKNLPHLGYRTTNGVKDPVVGTIGRSYGGAFQLVGSGLDSRVDAMVPGGTWYDFRSSLNPGGVPKTAYLDGLVALGLQSNRFRYDPFLFQGLAQSNTTAVIDQGIIDELGLHGSNAYCDPTSIASKSVMTKKNVPAFFVQGLKDVLFPINEAIKNFQCFRKDNPASRLLFVKYGHTFPQLQEDPATAIDAQYAFNESKVWLKSADPSSCPAGQYDTATGRCIVRLQDWMFEFLVTHLIGPDKAKDATYLGRAPSPLPEITAVMEQGTRQPTAVALPADATTLRPEVPTVEATARTVAAQTVVTGPVDATQLVSTANALGQLGASPLGQTPLTAVRSTALTDGSKDTCYIGVPKAVVTVASPSPATLPSPFPAPVAVDPIVYIGIGVQGADGKVSILHDQITPLKGFSTFNVDMNGISVRLKKGEKLTFVVQGYSGYFLSSFSRVVQPVSVSAKVRLPVPTQTSDGFCS